MQLASSSPLGQSCFLSHNQFFGMHWPLEQVYSCDEQVGVGVGDRMHLGQQFSTTTLDNCGKQFPIVGQGLGSQVTLLFQHEHISHPLVQDFSGSMYKPLCLQGHSTGRTQ